MGCTQSKEAMGEPDIFEAQVASVSVKGSNHNENYADCLWQTPDGRQGYLRAIPGSFYGSKPKDVEDDSEKNENDQTLRARSTSSSAMTIRVSDDEMNGDVSGSLEAVARPSSHASALAALTIPAPQQAMALHASPQQRARGRSRSSSLDQSQQSPTPFSPNRRGPRGVQGNAEISLISLDTISTNAHAQGTVAVAEPIIDNRMPVAIPSDIIESGMDRSTHVRALRSPDARVDRALQSGLTNMFHGPDSPSRALSMRSPGGTPMSPGGFSTMSSPDARRRPGGISAGSQVDRSLRSGVANMMRENHTAPPTLASLSSQHQSGSSQQRSSSNAVTSSSSRSPSTSTSTKSKSKSKSSSTGEPTSSSSSSSKSRSKSQSKSQQSRTTTAAGAAGGGALTRTSRTLSLHLNQRENVGNPSTTLSAPEVATVPPSDVGPTSRPSESVQSPGASSMNLFNGNLPTFESLSSAVDSTVVKPISGGISSLFVDTS